MMSLSALLVAAPVQAKPIHFQGLQIEVRGTGKPVLLVPGLNSAAAVWEQTCDALQADGYACHLLQLPGFAGVPALPAAQISTGFMAQMRDRLLAYISDAKLEQPALIGHSLGGALGLMMAIEQPDVLGKLVIVDSLPFFPAVMNPAASSQSMRPMAEGMRTAMTASSDEDFAKQTEASAARGMSRDPEQVKRIQSWGARSARATTTEAMYDLFTTDLRGELGAIKVPTLVLGAWAAYEPMGSTLDSTRAIYVAQYAKLDGVQIEMSPTAYHFIMLDDLDWMLQHVRDHLGE
jgi:pimeloyl-ACP methyl ester carboxylesterase